MSPLTEAGVTGQRWLGSRAYLGLHNQWFRSVDDEDKAQEPLTEPAAVKRRPNQQQ